MPYDRTPGEFSLSPTQLLRGFTMGYLGKEKELTQGQPYVLWTEEPQCTWEQDTNTSLLGVLRDPSMTWKQAHLQLGAMNASFRLLLLHVRELTTAECVYRLGTG